VIPAHLIPGVDYAEARRRWLREPGGRFRAHQIARVLCSLCRAEVADNDAARRNHERAHLLEHLEHLEHIDRAEARACAAARAQRRRIDRARAEAAGKAADVRAEARAARGWSHLSCRRPPAPPSPPRPSPSPRPSPPRPSPFAGLASARAPAPLPLTNAIPIGAVVNELPIRCSSCGEWIDVHEGYIFKDRPTGPWIGEHIECPETDGDYHMDYPEWEP
jgi:hypothetical protein